MAKHIHGDAPGVTTGRVGGTRTVLHRYEVVGDVLVRRRFADRRPFVEGEARLVDVLLDEDEDGRSIAAARGIVVRERDLARLGVAGETTAWREFEVGPDLMLAIRRDLGVGPRLRPAPRLVAVNGIQIERDRQANSHHDDARR